MRADCVVIPVFNSKGGVGKTTTTINIGAELVRRDWRVLLADLDETAGLTDALKLDWNPDGGGLSDALVPELSKWRGDPRELVLVHQDGLHAIPTDNGFEDLPTHLSVTAKGFAEARLSVLLDQLAPHYDVILLDCPPAQNMVTRSALYAGRSRRAGDVSGPIIPMLPEPASWGALNKLLGWISGLCPAYNALIEPLGLIVNEYDPRKGKLPAEYLARAQESTLPVLGVVKELTAAQKAWKAGRPVVFHDPGAALNGMYSGIVSLLTGEVAA